MTQISLIVTVIAARVFVLIPIIQGRQLQYELNEHSRHQRQTTCDETFTSNSGEFTSPNYPSNYPSNQDCYFYVTVTTGLVVKLEFMQFNVEDTLDYIEVYDGSSTSDTLIGSYTGSTLPTITISSTPNITAYFHSDDNIELQGFHVTFSSLNVSNDGGCGGTYTSDRGIITSPRYPMTYPRNQDCYYFITLLDDTMLVQLDFTYFSTEDREDYVSVINGPSKLNSEIGRYSGISLPKVGRTRSSSIIVYFHSNGIVEHKGFSARFSGKGNWYGKCGGSFTSNWGEVASINYPREYSNSMKCEYNIQVSSERKVQVHFKTFKTQKYGDNLYVYDGDCSSKKIGTYSGSSLPPTSTSSANRLCLKFVTNDRVSYPGFESFYTSIPMEGVNVCNSKKTSSLGGVFYSHASYPENYPSLVTCSLEIPILFHYHMVYIKVLDVDVYNRDIYNCSEGDTVVITPSDIQQTITLCGPLSNETEISMTSTSISILFVSAAYERNPFRGFKAIYSLYYQIDASQSCLANEFKCNNSRCISKSVFVGGYDFCGDNSFIYMYSDSTSEGTDVGLAVGLTFAFLAAVCGIASLSCFCYMKRKKRSIARRKPNPVSSCHQSVTTPDADELSLEIPRTHTVTAMVEDKPSGAEMNRADHLTDLLEMAIHENRARSQSTASNPVSSSAAANASDSHDDLEESIPEGRDKPRHLHRGERNMAYVYSEPPAPPVIGETDCSRVPARGHRATEDEAPPPSYEDILRTTAGQ